MFCDLTMCSCECSVILPRAVTDVWCRPYTLARRDAGAILIEAMSSVALTGARFEGNSAVEGAGGAIAIYGGGQESDVGKLPEIKCKNCSFTTNTAESGGAVAEKCATDDFGDGNAACPNFILDDSSDLKDNRASLSGAAVHWLTKAPAMCVCDGSMKCWTDGGTYDPCTDISANVLTNSVAYGVALSTNPVSLLATGADSLGELISGETATLPVVITLRDMYNQTASSGDGASAALIGSSPNVTLSAGSRAVMVGRCRLN